jgi:hypothetical protein
VGRATGEVSAADTEDHETSPEGLRAMKIGDSTEIITAGPPPADEDLLRFARDTALDEGSVAALLRHARLVDGAGLASAGVEGEKGEGGEKGVGGAEGTEGGAVAGVKQKGAKELPTLPLLHTAQEALILSGKEGLIAARGADIAPTITPPEGSLQTGLFAAGSAPGGAEAGKAGAAGTAGAVDKAAAARAAVSLPAALQRPASPEAGFSVSLASGGLSSDLATNRWMQSRAGFSEGAGGAAGASAASAEGFEGVADTTAEGSINTTEIDAKSIGTAKFDFEALRLRLGPEDQSIKDRLIKILGPEAARAAESGLEPEAARLESISLMESLIDLPDLQTMPDRTIDGLLGESDGLATMMGGGSTASGQGGGDGARPDPNASGQAGQSRILPQQIMQRFGELLSQRLLQQVTQGNWRVELDLEPGDLGSIRIELEMRKGEIEASIKATQASTRDLLQESLPRLKEALERSGMDVASLSVGQQDRRQSGGQSPSGRQSSGGQGPGNDAPSETGVSMTTAAVRDDGRLDVWV